MESGKQAIFREKSVETIRSPESLNDYLRVTSPGVWIVMITVIMLLVGVLIWGIFGSIDTSVQTAVITQNGQSRCVVPYEKLDAVLKSGEVTVDGVSYRLTQELSEPMTVSDGMDVYARLAGGFGVGDVVVEIRLDGAASEGVREGAVVTERIKPMSLLFQ